MVIKDKDGMWIESQANYLREATPALRQYRVYEEDSTVIRTLRSAIERRGREIIRLRPGSVEGAPLQRETFVFDSKTRDQTT